MVHPLLNAFTLAAFAFMVVGVMRPTDFLLVVFASLVVTHAAPTFHHK
ncbi:MAG TPA: hypothetical protein VI875_03395 [Candidatus Norongarragalinales archaeon]|nr:hypothetical protein [Candidatus Norongarragalinales archaeon]